MFELIRTAVRRRKPPTHGLFDLVSMDFRVSLWDLDHNMHLNNAKYLKFMDRCRLEHSIVTGLMNKLIEARCHAVVANTEVAYVRELRPYQRFTVHTRILGWDDKYVYYDQQFESQNKLHTHALLRVIHFHNGKPISPSTVQDIAGVTVAPPVLPSYIENWKTLLQTKRQYTEREFESLHQND
ncbi:MAG TPA: acyl-CoA thioesterase [Alcanivoracaceae bacterium]|nr:acyl-CoA thioesterase [Alcanivoracaceae bacterium]